MLEGSYRLSSTCKGEKQTERVTYGVGGGLLALLVLSVMPRHCAVGCLGLQRATIRAHQYRCHHTQRT